MSIPRARLVLAVALLGSALGCTATTTSVHPAASKSPEAITTPPGSTSPADALAVARKVPCPADAATPPSRQQLAKFAAVAVVTCETQLRVYSGHLQWQVEVRQDAVTGIRSLQAAYARPDDPPSVLPCAADAVRLLPVAFVDSAGHVLLPAAPTNSCGGPQQAAIKATHQVHWQEVSARKVGKPYLLPG